MDALKTDYLHLGDCLPWLQSLPDKSIDLVVSSPPYNIGKKYEVRRELQAYLGQQSKVLQECHRVLKDSGSVFWQVGVYSDRGVHIPLDVKFFPVLEDIGMIPRNRIVWIRPHGLHAKRKFSGRHEAILWFSKTDDYKFDLDPIRVPQKYQNKKAHRGVNHGELTCNPLGKNPGDIWLFQNVKHNHEEQTIHPAQFPEDLISRIVLATTAPGDIVMDPYMGTGTVAVVARDHQRRFLGAEVDDSYFEVASRRIAGQPDENGRFANLKCLRQYCSQTGEPLARYSFDVQVGRTPSATSKRFSEEHHRDSHLDRLLLEETAFGDRLRDLSDGLPNLEQYRPSTLFDSEAV